MNRTQKSRLSNDRGFTLSEMIIVVGILSILMSLVAIYSKQWLDKYNSESQIRQMHADLLKARTTALQNNLQYSVAINTNTYLISSTSDTGLVTSQTPVTLNYQVASIYDAGASSFLSSVTLSVDSRGIISTSTNSNLTSDLAIVFNTGSGQPEYDCLDINAMRINIGSHNGTNCSPK